jgi:hypothetical protein
MPGTRNFVSTGELDEIVSSGGEPDRTIRSIHRYRLTSCLRIKNRRRGGFPGSTETHDDAVHASLSPPDSAPAGIIAVVDLGRALVGHDSLDGPTQTLPALYALPATDFHSVSPNNGFFGTGGLPSILGYLFSSGGRGATANIATGLGSPNGPTLIRDLVSSKPTTDPSLRTHGGERHFSAQAGLTHQHEPIAKRATHRHVDQHGHRASQAQRQTLFVAGRRLVEERPRIET